MGKRSSFKRNKHDAYATPHKPVTRLIPFIKDVETFSEPCCGNGDLVFHLTCHGKVCVQKSDIQFGRDALTLEADDVLNVDAIITNPPWTFKILEPMLERFIGLKPTWLLLSADYAHNQQSAWSMAHCSDVVTVGRVKWIRKSRHSAIDNSAWYRFQAQPCTTTFHSWEFIPSLLGLMEEAA